MSLAAAVVGGLVGALGALGVVMWRRDAATEPASYSATRYDTSRSPSDDVVAMAVDGRPTVLYHRGYTYLLSDGKVLQERDALPGPLPALFDADGARYQLLPDASVERVT